MRGAPIRPRPSLRGEIAIALARNLLGSGGEPGTTVPDRTPGSLQARMGSDRTTEQTRAAEIVIAVQRYRIVAPAVFATWRQT